MTSKYKDIEYTLTRSNRKTASIYIERDGSVSILVPERLTDAEIDDLIEKMQYTVERKALASVQQEIFAKIVADDPYLFLYIPNSMTVVNKKIRNIEPSINGIWHNYIDWEIEE